MDLALLLMKRALLVVVTAGLPWRMLAVGRPGSGQPYAGANTGVLPSLTSNAKCSSHCYLNHIRSAGSTVPGKSAAREGGVEKD